MTTSSEREDRHGAGARTACSPIETPGPRLRAPGAVLLVSCYELGRQPMNLASPWAQLEAAGFGVAGVDTSIESLDDDSIDAAQLIAISVPMHTALRLGVELARRIRTRAPQAHLCFYGLYALLNADYLLDGIADSVMGGEIEQALVQLAQQLAGERSEDPPGVTRKRSQLDERHTGKAVLEKLPLVRPQRASLPPPDRYATLIGPRQGERRQAGYVEASRGCRYHCRHCPVVPVYRGRFFVVPEEVVLADAAQQIERGARHITFGDPDFFCGPKHSMKVARALALAHPGVSFDITAKVEHIIRHRAYVEELGELGCAFIISAVESLSDRVLTELDKGHRRRDAFDALRISRQAGVPLRPSLVTFTPWTQLEDYLELLDWVVVEGLIDHLEPVQLAIRLLIPPGSALLWQEQERPWLGELAREDFSYAWSHPDPRMDALFEQVSAALAEDADADAAEQVERVRQLAYAAAGRRPPTLTVPERHFVPRMSETWFCCAEPNPAQLKQLGKSSAGCCPDD